MTPEEWNEANADDGGPRFEDLFPDFGLDQIEADRQENEARTRRLPR